MKVKDSQRTIPVVVGVGVTIDVGVVISEIVVAVVFVARVVSATSMKTLLERYKSNTR